MLHSGYARRKYWEDPTVGPTGTPNFYDPDFERIKDPRKTHCWHTNPKFFICGEKIIGRKSQTKSARIEKNIQKLDQMGNLNPIFY